MKTLIEAVRTSIKGKNFYAGLFMALTLPDICAKLENPANNNTFQRYKDWFEKYLDYNNLMSGDDCYALRCAILHEGTANITAQRKRQTLEYVLFIEDGAHLNVFRDCVLTDGKKQSFLQLNVQQFCEDICLGVETWMNDVEADADIQQRMADGVEIHPQGFVHHGIQFS